MSTDAQPIVTLVGMSGVGKSHQAERLAAVGWEHHDCDAAIADRLGTLVTPLAGEAPVTALGRWMGMPYTDGHFDREEAYLALEREATSDAIGAAQRGASERAQLIDTTGSVIYLEAPLLERLRAASRVVYLRTPLHAHEAMRLRYLAEPKPVIWGSSWSPREQERPEDALARCYPELLRARDERYLAIAHVVLDAEELRASPDLDLATLALG